MRILLIGKNGQVGWELERALAPLGEVIATDRSTLDLTDFDAIRRVVLAAKPEVIVNAAAYTAVDRAEVEPELAMRINGDAPGVLAEEAKHINALLVHYSTDYVFDGTKATPYVESDTPNPINVYGRSKLAGERAIEAAAGIYLILRTSWVYGPRGSNFLLTVLKRAREGMQLRVVRDQVGAPTSANELAAASTRLIESHLCRGLYHLTAQGSTSWHGFATEIVRLSGYKVEVEPIAGLEYPARASRPANSMLNCAKLAAECDVRLGNWRDALPEVLARVSL